MNSLYPILVLGDRYVGKTSLIVSLVQHVFFDPMMIDPTIQEDSYRKMLLVDDVNAVLDVRDANVSMSIESEWERQVLRERLIPGTRGFVLVCDLTNRASFDALADIHALVRETLQLEITAVPCVVAATKCDLPNQQAVALDEVQAFAASIGAPCLETSAKTRWKIDELFAEVVRQAQLHEHPPPPLQRRSKLSMLRQRLKSLIR